MSKYDYRDPAQSPEYCDGLAADGTMDALAETDDPTDCDMCAWCVQPYTDRAEYPYCSTLCAVQAEIDEGENTL